MEELTIDKAFDRLCPALAPDEYKILKAGIIADGCLQPIITWAGHQGTILDGHNRYRICQEHEIPFKTKALNIPTREDAEAWIIRNQLGRRNLNDGARAMLAAKLANLKPGDNQHSQTEVAQICATSQAEIAEEFDVSRRTLQNAKQVLDHGTKSLQDAVAADEIPVSVAAAVAELPKAEQKKVVAKGPEAVKAAAKKVKADKPSKAKPKEPESELSKIFKKIDDHLQKIVVLMGDINRWSPQPQLKQAVIDSLDVAKDDLRRWQKSAK